MVRRSMRSPTQLTRDLAGLAPVEAPVAFYSTVTAQRIDTTTLDTDYWVRNLRHRVRFADAIEALLADGHRVFIEASPHPVLTLGMQETFEQAGVPALAIPTLRRDHGDRAQLLRASPRRSSPESTSTGHDCTPPTPPPAPSTSPPTPSSVSATG